MAGLSDASFAKAVPASPVRLSLGPTTEAQRLRQILFLGGRPSGYLRALQRHWRPIRLFVEQHKIWPAELEIQPSGTCNMSCRFCGFQEQRARHGHDHLWPEHLKRLIEQIAAVNRTADSPLRTLKFNGIFSEPLAGPAKHAVHAGIDAALRHRFSVGLYSNGLNLDSGIDAALLGKGQSAQFVNISLDVPSAELYRTLKRPHLSVRAAQREFELVCGNVRALVDMRDAARSGLQVYLSVVLQEETAAPPILDALVHLGEELGVDSLRFRYPYRTRNGAPHGNALDAAYRRLAELRDYYTLAKGFQVVLVYPQAEVSELSRRLSGERGTARHYDECFAQLLHLTLAADGNFYPCDHRGYAGGGAIGGIEQRYDQVLSQIRGFSGRGHPDPISDPLCRDCAVYNHNLNTVVDLLVKAHRSDREICDRLEEDGLVEARLEPSPPTVFAAHPGTLVTELEEPDQRNPGNQYAGRVVGEDFDGLDFLSEVFSTERFLRDCLLLRCGPFGGTQTPIAGQPELVSFITSFLERRRIGDLGETVHELSGRIITLLDEITFQAAGHRTAEERERFLTGLPGYVLGKLGSTGGPSACHIRLKAFSELIVDALYFQSERLTPTYFSYLGRQALLTLTEFERACRENAERIFGARPYTPVVLLADAEPLLYPFLGLLPQTAPRMPVALGFNRLSLLTDAERQEYRGAINTSQSAFSRAALAREGRLYRYCAGDRSNRGALLDAAEIALRSGRFHAAVSGGLGDSANDASLLTQSLFQIHVARHLSLLADADQQAARALRRILKEEIPPELKTPGANPLFIDSGIHGTLPSILSGLIILERLEASTPGKALARLNAVLANPASLLEEPLPAGIFLYGCTPELAGVVPNAGFSRFGHGGVHSLIDEQIPKFSEFTALKKSGMCNYTTTSELRRHCAKIWLKQSKALAQELPSLRTVNNAGALEQELRAIAESRQQKLLLFVDFDNVVARPRTYVGSSRWFGDSYGNLPRPPSAEEMAELRKNLDIVERRLLECGGFELVCDLAGLRARLGEHIARVVLVTTRNESARDLVDQVLNDHEQTTAVDEISFAPRDPVLKRQRVEQYLSGHSGGPGLTAVFVDDTSHHVFPFLQQPSTEIVPIWFNPGETNHRNRDSRWFLLQAADWQRKGARALA